MKPTRLYSLINLLIIILLFVSCESPTQDSEREGVFDPDIYTPTDPRPNNPGGLASVFITVKSNVYPHPALSGVGVTIGTLAGPLSQTYYSSTDLSGTASLSIQCLDGSGALFSEIKYSYNGQQKTESIGNQTVVGGQTYSHTYYW